MSQFVRNLLIAIVGVFLVAQFVEAYQHLPVHAALGIDPSFHRFAFAWQWATYPWVELPGDLSIINLGLGVWILATLCPVIEQAHGRAELVRALAAGVIGGGVLGTLVGLVFPPVVAASGTISAIDGAAAFLLWNRRHSRMLFALVPGSTTTFELGAKQMGAVLLGFAIFRFVMLPSPTHLAVDLGGLLGGLGYAVWRERRAARAVVRHSFTVLRGGKSDRTLH